MLDGLDLGSMQYVVELGPGTGCITNELYQALPESSQVLVIEINPEYYDALRTRFGNRFDIRKDSAHRIQELADELGWPRIDLIISSLPITLPDEVLDPLYDTLKTLTKEKTTYRFFTYVPPLMKRKYCGFSLKLEHRVLFNFPPMWIYSARSE